MAGVGRAEQGGAAVQDVQGQRVRALLPGMRRLLVAFAGLTVLGFTALFIGSTQTERAFAWTIDPPLTAAFLGAGYGAGCVLVLLALRARAWVHARVAVVTVLVFMLFTLLATGLHLDRLHFAAPDLLARAAAWFWTAVYVLVPIAMLALLPLQERVPGGDPPRLVPLPRALSAVLAVQGTLMLAVGAVLFAFPASQSILWPWQLTPLTSRTVGSWLIAFGFAAWLALRERDLERLELAAIAYTAFGTLELVALVRFLGVVRWGQPAAWVYLALLLTIVPTGVVGWAAVRRTMPRGGRPSW